MSERCIVSVKFSLAGSARLGSRAARGFVGYIAHRDQHADENVRQADGLVRYVGFRDRSGAGRAGRTVGPRGLAGDLERREFVGHVRRSLAGMPAGSRTRSVYRLVISPQRADGLDLEQLARSALAELERECGGLPPWVAAIHRNTQHPHVHVVLAARRELADGRYRGILISKPRLQRMKAAVGLEIQRQRGDRSLEPLNPRGPRRATRRPLRGLPAFRIAGITPLQRSLRRWSRRLQRELELEERRRQRDSGRER